MQEVAVELDSDDELPFISFTSSKMPSGLKNSEDTNATEELTLQCHDRYRTTAALSDNLRTSSDSAGVVVLDLDSSDNNESWKDCGRSLQERCGTNTVDINFSSCTESCDLQSGLGSATASVTDSQSCYSSVTDDSPATWNSCETSETQTTASDMNTNSQASSVQSDGSKRRKRPQKADDPEALVCASYLLS